MPLISEVDLRYIKVTYEEGLKHALQYDLAFESPIIFVERFFT